MACEKMFDPANQKAFADSTYKENEAGGDSYLKYGTLIKHSNAIKRKQVPLQKDKDKEEKREAKDYESHMTFRMPSRKERAWPASTTPPTRTIPRVTQPPPVMKPVSRDVKSLLYQGLSHNGAGRSQYLQHRYQDPPKEKFYFPVCSSWEYGWGCG